MPTNSFKIVLKTKWLRGLKTIISQWSGGRVQDLIQALVSSTDLPLTSEGSSRIQWTVIEGSAPLHMDARSDWQFATQDFPSQCQSTRAAAASCPQLTWSTQAVQFCVYTALNLVLIRPSDTQSSFYFLLWKVLCFVLLQECCPKQQWQLQHGLRCPSIVVD